MSPDRVHAANRAAFAELVARPDRDVDLARAALAIAAAGRLHVDPQPSLDELDRLAEAVEDVERSGAGDATAGEPLGGEPLGGVVDDDRLWPGAPARLRALHTVLYRRRGFRGPRDGPSDAAHSLLDLVLARRVGLPISLAIVEMEVAGRVGLEVHGIGLPGHFIIGGPGGLLIDPADSGRLLTRDDCQALIRRSLARPVLLRESMLRPAARRAILARVLRNLRVARLVARDWPGALAAIELLEVLEPDEAGHARDRGLLLGRMGRFSDAVALLGAYVELNPSEGDAEDVRTAMGVFAARRN
jgi:regulator of sirC expression with transglutaminase-like and TPR domain